jgi:hypothetical protein
MDCAGRRVTFFSSGVRSFSGVYVSTGAGISVAGVVLREMNWGYAGRWLE